MGDNKWQVGQIVNYYQQGEGIIIAMASGGMGFRYKIRERGIWSIFGITEWVDEKDIFGPLFY